MARTLDEVAKYAGVSRSTVSRVINDHPNVSAATRARVEAAIEKCGITLIHWPIPYGCNALASCGLRGLPTVVFGPGDVECAHRPNEYLEVRDLWKATEVFGSAMELNGAFA